MRFGSSDLGVRIKPIQPDRSKIDLDDAAAVRHWVKTLGASREAIAAAIEKVGANPATVCKELARETIDDQKTRRAEAK